MRLRGRARVTEAHTLVIAPGWGDPAAWRIIGGRRDDGALPRLDARHGQEGVPMIDAGLRALAMAAAVGWEILWPLVLGVALSAAVQAVVSHREMSRLLPDDRSRSIATALGLGAASSSCSYAAVALARSIFRKGANFSAAMAFEMASTNLVAELSIIIL